MEYEKNKTIIYNQLNNNKLQVSFQKTFFNKKEILELFMYSTIAYEKIITGKPNDKYDVKNNFKNIHNMINRPSI